MIKEETLDSLLGRIIVAAKFEQDNGMRMLKLKFQNGSKATIVSMSPINVNFEEK